MTYISIVDTTPDNKIAKFQEYETKQEADDHILRVKDSFPNAFVVDKPEPYVFDYMIVDVVAKTITFDKARYDSDQTVIASTKYQRDRKPLYGTWEEQLDMMYHGTWKNHVAKVKADIPKGNS